MNTRRKLVIALGATALTAPFGSFAQQQSKVWRAGFLSLRRADSLDSDAFGAFPRGMRDLGYAEGKNLVIEWRFADGRHERLSGLAAELVQMKVDIIVTSGTDATSAAQKATTTIPIVIGNAGDPVGSGFAKTLARPGGNITGLSNLAGDITSKQLEILLDVVPKLSRVAILLNPLNSSLAGVLKDVRSRARKASVEIVPLEVRTAPEIGSAFALMTKARAGAVIVARDPIFNQEKRQIAEHSTKNRMPSIAGISEFVEAGCLMSYGQNSADNFRRAATFVDKIFKGAKPGDLPIEQPTKFELVVNLKTARALGITIPQSVRFRADRVIE